tara:strand:+ start:57 stop:770 length:714 start_codon:yes stop_codon:yes gene_type:complete
MKNYFSFLLIVFLTLTGSAIGNDIYIEQVGDTLDLDIVQDGQNNVIGTSVQSVVLGSTGNSADSMTFDITQTGDSNTITAQILGNTYTGTWVFTGDGNEVDLLCSSAASGNCESVTLNITGTGDNQDYTINIGEASDADGSVISFTVTDDNTVITTDIDGTSAAVTVSIDENSSLVSTNNTIDIDITGNGDSVGHTITLDSKGKGNNISLNQSGIYDNTIDLTTVGDNADIDIIQRD